MLDFHNFDETDWHCTIWWWKLQSVKYDFIWNMRLLEYIQNA